MSVLSDLTAEHASSLLAEYDSRRTGGYKNQQIAAANKIRRYTGLTVRELRAWLKENGHEVVAVVPDPRGDGYSFCTANDGDYGAPSLDEAIILAESLGYDYEVES